MKELDTIRRGERLIVRTMGGRPAVVRMWDRVEGGLAVVDDIAFGLLEAGVDTVIPVGIPFEDVFEYDESSVAELDAGTEFPRWDTLRSLFRPVL